MQRSQLRITFAAAVVLLASMATRAAGVDTARELLAAHDEQLVEQLAEWDRGFFVLSDDELDEPLRQAAVRMVERRAGGSPAAWRRWIAQERLASGNPDLQGKPLQLRLVVRELNEFAVWSLESGGPEQDAAWTTAALAPLACQSIPLSFFARRVAMIQAAPPSARPALLRAEEESLARWGAERRQVPPRPSTAELEAADHAVSLLRTGLPVAALPMAPHLAEQVFGRNRKPGRSDRWEQCAKSQWWLASQLNDGKTDPAAALALYRYASMVLDVENYIPSNGTAQAAAAAPRPSNGGPTYPSTALHFQVQGTLTVEADADADGKFLRARVVSREITVPGIRDRPPSAFEALLDAASLEMASKRKYPTGRPLTGRFEVEWRLE